MWNTSPDGVEIEFYCWFWLVLTCIQWYCAHIQSLQRCMFIHHPTLKIMITNMEWSLCLMILRLRRWLVYSAIFVLHSVERTMSPPSVRPRLKCRDGLPLSVTTILTTICAPNMEQSGWNMTRSIPVLIVINFSPMCLSYSRHQSKCILFPSTWAMTDYFRHRQGHRRNYRWWHDVQNRGQSC